MIKQMVKYPTALINIWNALYIDIKSVTTVFIWIINKVHVMIIMDCVIFLSSQRKAHKI